MTRPRKAELVENLYRKGYDVEEMDRYDLIAARDRVREELEKLEDELNSRLSAARKLVELLEELRGILCDSNVWVVLKRIIGEPGSITGEVTRGYGTDHREALSRISRLVEEGYITRSDLELDPVRQRYVRYQYPGPRLIELLEKLAETANKYRETYGDILRLKAKIKDRAETLNNLEKYIRYYT